MQLLERRAGRSAAEAFVELCTFSSGGAAISAPLVPIGEFLIIPSGRVSSTEGERTLLRAAAARPARSGGLEKTLGDIARQWAAWLATIPGVTLAERVMVRGDGGCVFGDLDVAAIDVAGALTLVFASKWPVDSATLNESNKIDRLFESGRQQLSQLRRAIETNEAAPTWPDGWDVSRSEVKWWVGSAQQLDSRAPRSLENIGTTSLRLLEHLLALRVLGGARLATATSAVAPRRP